MPTAMVLRYPFSRPVLPLRQPPASDPSLLSHEDILAREKAAVRRQRGRWVWWTVAALALALGIGFGSRPLLHGVKAWQARRLAAEARRLMDEGKWLDARTKISDASAIWQNEPEAMRVSAQFLARVGYPRQALPIWKRLEEFTTLTPDDQRDFAAAELAAGNTDAAAARLLRAWPAGSAGTRADWQLGTQLALRREDMATAAALARRILADPPAPERARFTAAGVLLSTDGSAEAQTLGWQAITAVAAGGKSPESLDALMALARGVATTPAGAAGPAGLPPVADLIARIEAHPLAKIQHRLVALDLRAAQEPARRGELVQSVVDRYGGSHDDAELAVLTAWLYGKGEFDKLLAILTPERASSDRALFLQRLDTLGALARWKDIRAAIQEKKFPLEPMLAQMYLARCAEQLGEPAVRDACWEAAFDAAGTDAAKLLQVGQYAQKNGALDTAGKSLRAAVAAAPDSREANEALFRLLESTGQTRELHDALIAFVPHAPQDRALRNDIAYFDALLDVNVAAARDAARELLQAEPASLPHRTTLALAELRLNDGLGALDVFRGIRLPGPAALPTRPRAVYAAVLWKTSYEHEAREMVRGLASGQLLPEERELIRPILEAPVP